MKWNCTNSLLAPVAAIALSATFGTAVGQSAGDRTASTAGGSGSGFATSNFSGSPFQQEGGIAGACGSPITQNTNPNLITPANTVQCAGGTPQYTTANGLARSFPAGTFTAICAVQFGIETSAAPDWPVTVNIYAGNIAGPFASLQLLGSSSVVIPGGTASAFFTASFDPPVVPIAGQPVVVELFHASRNPADGGPGGTTWPASNTAGQAAPSYIRAAACGLTNFSSFASIGFPNVHLVMTVFDGEPGADPEGACCIGEGEEGCQVLTAAACAKAGGNYLGNFVSCANCPSTVECPDAGNPCGDCVGDLNQSGAVDVQDLLILLGAWGPCPGCCADLNNSGTVDVQDLLILLGAWGLCPAAADSGPSGNVVVENEPCGDDTNGGCNATPNAYTAVECGDTVCGTAWANGGTRDTDWYTITVTDSTTITWRVHAEFPAFAAILNDQCGDGLAIIADATGIPGVPFEMSACVNPGTYRLFVAVAAFEGFPCGSDNAYVAEVTCRSCTGACCYNDGANCDDLTASACASIGGDFQGAGTECATTSCPLPCPLGTFNEGEPCGDDTNGGCNSTPNVFQQICCGDTVNGNTWADGGTRDTDWYTITIDQESTIRWTVGGQMPLAMFILNDNCGALVLLAEAYAPANGSAQAKACLPAGTYRLWVGPGTEAGGTFEGFPCGGGNNAYTATVTCSTPCDPPEGDNCGDAIPLTLGVAGSGNSTGNAIDPLTCGGAPAPNSGTLWFAVEGNGNVLRAESCGSALGSVRVAVLCGSCTDLICLDGAFEDEAGECGNSFQSAVEWCSAPGQLYYIKAWGAGATEGSITMTVLDWGGPCTAPADQCGDPPPPNDTCADAIDITANINGAPVVGNNNGATTGGTPAGSPSCHWTGTPGGPISNVVWYKLTAPAGGTLQVITCNTTGAFVDSVLMLFSGTCGALVEVGCGEDDCPTPGGAPYYSEICVSGLTPGATYYLAVANSAGWAGWVPGEFTLNLSTTCDAPPPPSCVGFCGGAAPSGCWCDADCCGFGDCCPDQTAVCGLCP